MGKNKISFLLYGVTIISIVIPKSVLAVNLLTIITTLSMINTLLAQTPKFKANVEQVVVYATVHDSLGQLVSNLQQNDFNLFENKILQNITYFGLDDIPSTIGIVMDNSGSMRGKKHLVDKATQLFLETNNPANELFLLAFNSKVRIDENFTRDIEDIQDSLFNQMVGGGTALYDAIFLAVDHASHGSEPKKIVIVFTDGEDKDSYYTLEEVVEKVEESFVQVFLIALLSQDLSDDRGLFGVFRSKRDKVSKSMVNIAESTGGKAYFPKQATELKEIFKEIGYELRTQYRLAFVSNIKEKVNENGWRSLQVELVNAQQRGLRVRARAGYYRKGASNSAH